MTLKDFALQAGLFLASFLLPIKVVGLAISFLVGVDLVTGIWASIKTNKRITSDRLGRSVSKSLVYIIALIVAQVAKKYVFLDSVPLVTVVSGFIGSTELLSIYENLSRISGLDFKKLIIEKILPSQAKKEDR